MKDKNVLIVDGDRGSALNISRALRQEGYSVDIETNAFDAVDFCIRKKIDLIILELNLNGQKDGSYVIDTIRSFTKKLPIIVVSNRINVESKIDALDRGCNDYLTKPFNIYELLARIRKELRVYNDSNALFVNGDLSIDYSAKSVFVQGREIHFTTYEYKILELLSSNWNRTLSYEFIINHVWGKGGNDNNGLRVFMTNIRSKLKKEGIDPSMIRTDIGTGLRMVKI